MSVGDPITYSTEKIEILCVNPFRFPLSPFKTKQNKTTLLPSLEYSLYIRITESSKQPHENSVLLG